MNNSVIKDQDLIFQFLQHFEVNKGRSSGTVNSYSLQLNRLSDYLHERSLALSSASPEDIEAFTGLHLHSRGITPRSRRVPIAAIRIFFQWLHRKGVVTFNPAENLGYPKTGRKLPGLMSLQSAEALFMQPDLATFIGVRDLAMIAVMLGCGLRVSGLVRLNEGDLAPDIDGNGNQIAALRVREKGDHERRVPVPDETLLMLRAYLGHPYLQTVDRTTANGDLVLFINVRNGQRKAHERYGEARRLTKSSVQRMLVKYGEQAGIPREQSHPHALRHLYGTELTEEGTDTLTIQQLMGHKSAESTKLYVHTSTRRLREAVRAGNPLGKIQTPVSGLAHILYESDR